MNGLRPCGRHGLFDTVKSEVQKSAHTFLHDRHNTPLVLPMEVNIVLVGPAGYCSPRHGVPFHSRDGVQIALDDVTRAWRILLATSEDVIQLNRRGFYVRSTTLLVPGGYRSPCHWVPLYSRDEGSKCVVPTWRAISARPYVLVGLDGSGAYRYRVDEVALSAFLHDSFCHFRPSCLETGKQLEAGYVEPSCLESIGIL